MTEQPIQVPVSPVTPGGIKLRSEGISDSQAQTQIKDARCAWRALLESLTRLQSSDCLKTTKFGDDLLPCKK